MDLSFLASPDAWLTLVTLSALEIVLGIDNLVFISIAVGRLPEHQRPLARKIGIAVACISRILLLVMLAFLARMEKDLFSLFGMEISTAGVSHAEFMIFGALIVWFLIVEPHGLAKLWSIGKQKMRIWPFPH